MSFIVSLTWTAIQWGVAAESPRHIGRGEDMPKTCMDMPQSRRFCITLIGISSNALDPFYPERLEMHPFLNA